MADLHSSASDILHTIRGRRIGIVGDLCLDFYLFLDELFSETSVETGIPARSVRRFAMAPGGGANVAREATVLGAEVRLFGIAGDDAFGWELLRLLEESGVSGKNIVLQKKDWTTSVFAKPYSAGREEARLDFGNFNTPADESFDRILAEVAACLPEMNALIVNDQRRAGLNRRVFRRRLHSLFVGRPDLVVVVDSRENADDFAATIRKVNVREARAVLGGSSKVGRTAPAPSDREALELAERLWERWNSCFVITRGERGLLVRDSRGSFLVQGVQISGPVDPVGAGDCLTAALAAALSTGADLRESAAFANLAAAVTVRKRFETGTASGEEILALAAGADFRRNVDLAEDPGSAELLSGTTIELVTAPKPRRIPLHAVFDNDGTLSTLREGWEAVMQEVMVVALLDKENSGNEERLRARETAKRLIEESTGIRTIEQMRLLRKIVLETGRFGPDEIPEAEHYKATYLARLENMIRPRLAGLKDGRFRIDDFVVKGAGEFLEILADQGVILHLVSGTDAEALAAEVEALGLSRFFGGRVQGAVDSDIDDPKRQALSRIVGTILERRDKPGETAETDRREADELVVVFGDGPVEMREARRHGFLALGVASDEARRFGFNPTKRRRLIEGGADLLIPDFSDPRSIFAAAGWPWPGLANG